MDFETFERLLAETLTSATVERLPPELKPFDLVQASPADIARVETELAVDLPDRYRTFLLRHGGGDFLYLDLLPAISANGRDEDLLSVNRDDLSESDFIAIAPVGSGDWWGFRRSGRSCGEEVVFWFHDQDGLESANADVLEFLVEKGLRLSIEN